MDIQRVYYKSLVKVGVKSKQLPFSPCSVRDEHDHVGQNDNVLTWGPVIILQSHGFHWKLM